VDSNRPLLEQYLGALPSLHKNEQARDLGIHIPTGRMVKNVYAGKEDKALVRMVFSGSYQYNPENNILLHALGQVLQIKLLQHLREEESEVYSPSVQTIYNKYPQNRYALVVAFGCAPKNVDHLSAMVEKELDSLRTNGPDPADVQKYKASYAKSMELALKDNGFWLGYLSGHYENKEDIMEVLSMDKVLDAVTASSLKEAANRYLKGNNRIRFALLPASAAGTTSAR
jgi:zinc protease